MVLGAAKRMWNRIFYLANSGHIYIYIYIYVYFLCLSGLVDSPYLANREDKWDGRFAR